MYHGTLVLATPSKGRLTLVYPSTPMLAPFLSAMSAPRQHFLCLFFTFGPICVWLFEGIYKLYFLPILYSWKAIDVQFPMVLASFDLELRLLRY